MNRAISAVELLALLAVVALAYYGWEKIAAFFSLANVSVNQWIGQAPNGVQVTGVDDNGDPVGNIVPYPNPKSTAEIIANQAAAGVTRPDWGTGFAA